MYIKSYKELIVWQRSIELTQEIYKLTRSLPKEELYCLTTQMRRATISIPSNIAEGSRRKDLPEYLHFLRIADASSAELETQLVITKTMYPDVKTECAEQLLEEIQKMLDAVIQKLSSKRYNEITKS